MSNTPQWRRLHWVSVQMFFKSTTRCCEASSHYSLGRLSYGVTAPEKAAGYMTLARSCTRGLNNISGTTDGKTGSRRWEVCNVRDLRFDLGKEKTILSGLFRSRATGAAPPIKATAFSAYIYSGLDCASLMRCVASWLWLTRRS